jgi:hypothetical protein
MAPTCVTIWNTTENEDIISSEARFEEVTPGRTRIAVAMHYADPLGGR